MSNGYILQRKERKTRRELLINLLFERSYRYNELFKASGFGSKSTLDSHLDGLLEEGVVEKAIEKNETVYRLTLDPNVLLSESKNVLFDSLINSFDKQYPGLKTVVHSVLYVMYRFRLEQKMRDINNKPIFSEAEISYLVPEYVEEAIRKLDVDNQFDDSTIAFFVNLVNEGVRLGIREHQEGSE